MVLTHNIMILIAIEVFYRAGRESNSGRFATWANLRGRESFKMLPPLFSIQWTAERTDVRVNVENVV
jgi:hypothetical protein